MSIRIRYMGNKHVLAPDVASIVADLAPGRPFLDLFCGMCSVGAEVATTGRPVWGNDVQHVASLAARCLLVEPDDPPARERVISELRKNFERNRAALDKRFRSELHLETDALGDGSSEALSALETDWKHAANTPEIALEVERLSIRPRSTPYRLCTLTFANGYFGLRQAIDIDSVRYAIDRAAARKALTPGEARWARLALLQTASVIASTPGHFAQFLHAETDASASRVRRQRRRDVWTTCLDELESLSPIGDRAWRTGNRTFRRDALSIGPELRRQGLRRGVVYADPPYSADHYSRYYHVLETLLRYDYPSADGKGRYRPDRFATAFSIKTRVVSAFERLFKSVASLECALVLSYPENGLLMRRGADLEALLSAHFSSVEKVLHAPTTHSTLGGRHGTASNSVAELVYLAT